MTSVLLQIFTFVFTLIALKQNRYTKVISANEVGVNLLVATLAMVCSPRTVGYVAVKHLLTME